MHIKVVKTNAYGSGGFYNVTIFLMYCVHIRRSRCVDCHHGLTGGLARPTKLASIPGEGVPEPVEEATPRKDRQTSISLMAKSCKKFVQHSTHP